MKNSKVKNKSKDKETNSGVDTNAGKNAPVKRPILRKVLIGLVIFFACAAVIIIALGALLLSRVSRPGSNKYIDDTAEVMAGAVTPTPAPSTQTPALNITPTPPAAIEGDDETDEIIDGDGLEEEDLHEGEAFDTLPLSDIFPQTQLGSAQLAAIKAQNASTDVVNVLLVGVDRRGTQGRANADTIMIATIDKFNKRLKLTSILRDCYVTIGEEGEGRINSAMSAGDIEGLLETVNSSFMMNLENYVLVDFRMFEKIVDKLGGITVRMTEAEISAANDNIAGLNKQRGVEYLWDGFIFANPGSVRLNGKQALAYARIRKIDSDFTRVNRQHKALSAIFAKFRSKNVAQQYALLYDIIPMVETDLSSMQIIDLAISALSMDTGGILHASVPFEGYYKSGHVKRMSALALDLPMNAWLMHRFIYTSSLIPDEAVLYSGGPSLPPRTPSPTLAPGELDPNDPNYYGEVGGDVAPAPTQNNGSHAFD